MKNPSTEVCWSDEDLAYVAWAPGMPGCRTRGESPAQALSRLAPAMAAWLAAREPAKPAPEAASPAVTEVKAPKRQERITRLEAASRQLDAAIQLFFAGGDPLAVHALATAAGELFADRLARWNGAAPGDSLPRESYLRTLKTARELLRSCGGEESLEFDPARNDALIAQAIADRTTVCPTRPLSRDMAVFRDWYRAARAPETMPDTPGAVARPSRRRLALGRQLLQASPDAVQFSLLPEPARH